MVANQNNFVVMISTSAVFTSSVTPNISRKFNNNFTAVRARWWNWAWLKASGALLDNFSLSLMRRLLITFIIDTDMWTSIMEMQSISSRTERLTSELDETGKPKKIQFIFPPQTLFRGFRHRFSLESFWIFTDLECIWCIFHFLNWTSELFSLLNLKYKLQWHESRH